VCNISNSNTFSAALGFAEVSQGSDLKLDDKRLERNKKRREAYRKKKDETRNNAIPEGGWLFLTL
jgi:hypothetical protein